MTRRVYVGSLQHETNTFSPLRTGDAEFAAMSFAPGAHPAEPSLFSGPLWTARARAAAEGWTLVEGTHAGAQPGGLVNAGTWARLLDTVLGEIAAARPLDAVLLCLHGAMMADGCDDCEGALLAAVRDLVGPAPIIGVLLDPHGHLTPAMTRAADLLIAFKEYPHTDAFARAEELWRLTADAAAGRIPRPTMAAASCGQIGFYHTTREPMAGLVRELLAAEQMPGVLSLSVMHGFPWADTPFLGTHTLAVTAADPALAEGLADHFACRLRGLRGRTHAPVLGLDAAVARAAGATHFPVVLADIADNPGLGAPADSTYLLHALRAAGVTRVGAALIWDPLAVRLCQAAGEGAVLPLRVGGKACALSGPPLDLPAAQVARLTRDGTHALGGGAFPTGDVAAVVAGDLSLVLTTERCQCFSPAAFTDFGLDPAALRVLVVKSSQHFHAGFAPLAAEIIYAEAPGVGATDLRTLPYRRVPPGIWPIS